MASSSKFPAGLKVLLVDFPGTVAAHLQSPELSYSVTSVGSASEALALLSTGVAAFDVVLAESKLVACDEPTGRSFVNAFEDTPVVLMTEAATQADVLAAVQLGAVDFLDKPLSLLKLKNIWQHSVRKMMLKAAGPRAERCSAPTPVATATPVAVTHVVAPVPPSSAALSSWYSAGAAASLGPESPGTPSAMSGDLPEALSMSSMMEDVSQPGSLRGSFDSSPSSLHRDTSFTSLPSAAAPLASGGPAPAVWPALDAGCVWGTPANGAVPPPVAAPPAPAPPAPAPATWEPVMLPAAPQAPTLIKSSASCALMPATPSTHDLSSLALDLTPLPEGFLSAEGLLGGAAKASGPGPLGLSLRKSPSLLNMINAALAADAPLPGTCACDSMMGAEPMCLF